MSEFPYVVDTGLVWLKTNPLSVRRSTDHIQIHHTVGNYGTPAKWAALQESRQKATPVQKGVPYSYLILQDGTIYLGRGHACGHGGVRDSITNAANQRSVSIAFDGDMRGNGLPTERQLAAAVRLTKDLMALYQLPASAVRGHNEIPTYKEGTTVPTGKTYATLCPCIDMAAFRTALGAVAPEGQGPAAAAFPALVAYVGDTRVNVRSGPGTTHAVLGKLAAGQKCIALALNNGWAEIVLHEQHPMLRGWCIDTYLRRA